ncbi:VCBS domain-containing protein, partial [Mesorhizobium sp. KR9-304]|uniref:VCBS domain-containing protein n=1 Tax=Mesorhizobium sp. KR9-304 TaxID=3156614 RepID=UPI0032B3C5A4
MATGSAVGDGSSVGPINLSHDGGDSVRIADPAALFLGDYSRQGHDLLIEHDGASFLVQDYFAGPGANLVAPSGAFLTPSVVEALAGPNAPGQYAQAGTEPAGTEPAAAALTEIGKVVSVSGTATATHSDGVTVNLASGDPVYQGDVVRTGPESKLGISFIDDSVFSMSADARMVLNELVFDPAKASESSMVVDLVQGSFVFVTGQVAPAGNMKVETPVATMGIRGTTPKVLVNTDLGVTEFTILPDPDSGKIGSYLLLDKTTGEILGTVESVGDKWVITSLSGEAVKIAKSGLDLLEDDAALNDIREAVSKALGQRTELNGANSFQQVTFDSSSSAGGPGDGTGGSNDGNGAGGGNGGVDPNPGRDDPPIAGDDQFTLDEDSSTTASVIDGSVGGTDVDPDGFGVSVTEVDGAPLTFVSGMAHVILPSGAELAMTPGGGFTYNAVDAFDWLAVGEQTIDTFTYTIRDQNGFTDTATVTVTVIGRNDQPEIQIVKVDGSIVDVDEAPTVPPQSDAGTLQTDGSITFTDVDLSNLPTATFAVYSISAVGQDGQPLVLTNPQIAAIEAAFSISAEPGNTNNGTINWDYSIQEVDLDFLGADEVVTVIFTITVSDHSTGTDPNDEPPTATQNVTITIYGSEADAPVITAVDVDGAVSDIAETNPSASDAMIRQTTGSITFADVDETDRPVATFETKAITAVQGVNSPLVLTQDQYDAIEAAFSINPDGVPGSNTHNGTVTWDYSILESELDFLALGETVTAVYTITVTDDEGETDTVDVTVTITGANDHPFITVESGDDVSETLDEAETALTTSGSFSVLDVDVTDVVTVKSITVATSDNASGAP